MLALTIVANSLTSCASNFGDRSASAWVTGEPTPEDWKRFSDLPEDRFIDLLAGSIQNAVAELGDRSFVALDQETYSRLVRYRPWPTEPGYTPYLIRGVSLEESPGSLHVLQNGSELLVEFNGPIERARCDWHPIVVLLPSAPSKIYVAIYLLG